MQPQKIILKTGHHKEERWLDMILIGYLLLSIFVGVMFGIAISKIFPHARFALSILAGLFVLLLLLLNRGVVNEHKRIIGFIFSGFYMLTGLLLLFHPYLWIFGIAGVAYSLLHVYKHTELNHALSRKSAAWTLLGIVLVLIAIIAVSNLRHGDKAIPEFEEIQTSLAEEISAETNGNIQLMPVRETIEEDPCTWVDVKKVTYETRYLIYFRSVLVKNSTNSTVYDITPSTIGFNITNYLDIPIQVKVDYHKESYWYGINEDKWVTLPIPAATTYDYADLDFAENTGCDIGRCNLTITDHSLSSAVMRTEEIRQPIITTTTECQ